MSNVDGRAPENGGGDGCAGGGFTQAFEMMDGVMGTLETWYDETNEIK